MSTIRLQIVDAIAAALATTTGLKVHRNLDYALEDRGLPVLVVTAGEDQPADGGSPLGVLDQFAVLDIAILVSRSVNPEAAADPHEAAIHAWLYSATELAGQHVLIDRMAGGWEFDLGDTVARRLSYRFGYRTTSNNLES